MVYSKIKKIIFILLILLIVLFPFWCVRGFCASPVSPAQTMNARIDYQNYIATPTTDTQTLYIYPVISGHEYTFSFSPTSGGNQIGFFVYDTIPTVGDQLINVIYIGNNYKFTVPDDVKYFVFYASEGKEDVVLNDLNDEMSNSVDSLVSYVGISQFWDTFTDGIPMIGVCAVFVFGFVIVTYLILKLSKGKEGL